MATIHVDSKEYKVNRADNLLEACLSLGLDIPYFCWHPALGSISACHQCTVKQYQNTEDTRGHLVMSCMTPASNGTFISIDNKEAKQFHESVVKWLMTNHPHNCPVCEEGSNCHLQDMTMMTRHSFHRYHFTKHTHHNQDLGPFISHKMNHCITCYHCMHYYKDYTGSTDLGIYSAHNNIYFSRPEDSTLESKFSSNLVKICPTSIFTNKTHSKHYNHKWDMQFAPSICQQCSISCNISPSKHYGKLHHIKNHYNSTVNHYFLCNHGHFSYSYINLKDHPRQPVQHHGNDFITLNTKQAMQGTADILHQSKKVISIGSPRASMESNFALHELVGKENFYTSITHSEQEHLQLALKVLREGSIYTPALHKIKSYNTVLVLGKDITQTSTHITLAVHQAVKGKAREMAAAQKVADWQIAAILNISQHAKHPLFVTNIDDTHLDDITAWTYHAPVEDQARLGFAIAHALDNSAPAVDSIKPELQSKINIIMQALAGAKKPLIISRTNTSSLEVIQAAANIAKALKGHSADIGITMIAHSVNSMGLGIMGGSSLEEALTKLETRHANTVVVLENNLHHHTSATHVNAALAKAPLVMVVDHQHTAIMENTHLVLSAASFAESNSTVINNKGHAQHFFQVYNPAYYNSKTVMLESWHWLHSLHSTLLSHEVDWTQLNHVIDTVVAKIPELAGIKDAAPDATFHIHGQKLAHEPHHYSSHTTMHANISIHEPRQPQDIDTMFTFSMEGNNQPTAHHSQVPFAWAPGWNSPQAWNKFQDKVGSKLRFGNPGMHLFETSKNGLDYFTSIPAHFQPQDRKWHITPYYHLFGSNELSQHAPVFQSHMPQPYIKLNPADATKLGVNTGTHVSFSYNGNTVTLPVEITKGLTAGQVGLPMGMSSIAPVLAGTHLEDLKEAQQ